MKKLLFTLLLLQYLLPQAHAFKGYAEVNGIWYHFNTKINRAAVENPSTFNSMNYTGDIIIPSTIEYEGVVCSVEAISSQTFRNSTITSISIPNTISSIGYGAFANCKNLTSVVLPNSMDVIGESLFSGCTNLKSVFIPDGITTLWGNAFRGCSSLETISLPNSLTNVGMSAFEGFTTLKKIIIPDFVTSIGEHAFYGLNNLKTVILGKSVSVIDNGAFANCLDLADVYCFATVPPEFREDSFNGSYIDYITLHVPAASIDLYRQKWGGFKEIMPIDESNLGAEKCATPTMCWQDGRLLFECDTEGAVCQSKISDDDVNTYSVNDIQLGLTYRVSVYASKEAYFNSDVATATLCWLDEEQFLDNLEHAMQEPDKVAIVQTVGNMFVIKGVEEGIPIAVYNAAGKLLASAQGSAGATCLSAPIGKRQVCIVKIGDRAFKVITN
ncbi:MAG: leucine-rich repeat domain-containing protein [Prevotella sp.]|nr:leucine-rich repeat domain-containing protein [Prevotella sp.]